jgi:uncharacterized protein YbjQ (UPF0145 family)
MLQGSGACVDEIEVEARGMSMNAILAVIVSYPESINPDIILLNITASGTAVRHAADETDRIQ